ncbi:MAG: hypothetical protein RLZZ414_1369, partial [Bacteroidota bacterium]
MHQIKETLISDDLLQEYFVCDLNSCKGACCVEGDSGAPLLAEEKQILEDVYPLVEAYLTEEGKAEIQKQGKYVVDKDGDLVTPLLVNGTCVYATKDANNTLKCGIEQAYNEGKIDFKKPISCHLFPVRIKEYKTFTAVNVQLLDICSCACSLGKKLKVPVYQFLKEPL